MSFENTINDTPEPVKGSTINSIRSDLQRSRRSPEVIYIGAKRDKAAVEALLIELYGTRGERIPVLFDIKESRYRNYTIRWGL